MTPPETAKSRRTKRADSQAEVIAAATQINVRETEKPPPYPGIKQANIPGPKVVELKGMVVGKAMVTAAIQIQTIRKGMPSKTFSEVAKRVGLAQADLAKKLGLSPRTMASRLAVRGTKLTAEESEKTLRIQQIFEQATRVFGTEDEAREWLTSPAHGLEGQRPIDLLDTEPGSFQVRDYLGAIEYGNYW
jgi:putative toxin-antitoxin system antitoxin component (TIGR02293 family)